MGPDEIRATRQRLGLKPAQLAEQLGVSTITVRRWEMARSKHARNPSGSALVLLKMLAAKAAGLDSARPDATTGEG